MEWPFGKLIEFITQEQKNNLRDWKKNFLMIKILLLAIKRNQKHAMLKDCSSQQRHWEIFI